MRAAVALSLLLTLGCAVGCAERDEIIATVPDPGGGGAGPGPIVRLGAPVEHELSCGLPSDLATGDVDGDGVTDVLVGGDCLNVLRGTGTTLGAATAPVTSDFGATFALGFVDTTHPDQPTDPIDVVGFSQPTRIYLGDGMGAFDVHTGVDAGSGGAIALADLYGDGALELVTTDGAEVSLWTGDGSGTFVGPHPFALPAAALVVRSADVDDDGLADLLVATLAGVVVLRNAGAGELEAATTIAGTEGAVDLVLADLGGDGCTDALVLTHEAVLSLYNDCSGAFTAAAVADLADGAALVAGDLDGDGFDDVAVATATAVWIAGGANDGTFGSFHETPLAGPAERIVLADVDGDARSDIVVTQPAGIATLLNLPVD